jgi:hypothetical protein
VEVTAPALSIVETLYEKNASDIVAMLRQAADTIESETPEDNRTEAVVAVQLHASGAIQVYGWGGVDSLKAIGTLHLGAAQLTARMLDDET